MKSKGIIGLGLVIAGFLSFFFERFGGEFVYAGLALLIVGGSMLVREATASGRLRGLLRSYFLGARVREVENKSKAVEPLLPVKALKLAQSKSGVLTVSAVAMALEIGLDQAQAALDELVRKGAATVDVDVDTGIATYRFPEFLPQRQSAGT